MHVLDFPLIEFIPKIHQEIYLFKYNWVNCICNKVIG
jgi:hypothetical protein